MVWEDVKVEGDYITITKRELLTARDHYCKVADRFKPKKNDAHVDLKYMLYLGKIDVLTDLIKCFD